MALTDCPTCWNHFGDCSCGSNYNYTTQQKQVVKKIMMIIPIYLQSSKDLHQKLFDICSKIYMARNITMDNGAICDQLEYIDKLFKTIECDGEIEDLLKLMDETAKEIGEIYG